MTIAGQLPENLDDARLVLQAMTELLEMFMAKGWINPRHVQTTCYRSRRDKARSEPGLDISLASSASIR